MALSMRAIAFVLVAGAVGFACSSPSNTQYVPVGSACSSDDDCGTSPFTCNVNLPAGYCTRACMVDSDCPMDSHCVLTAAFGKQCRRTCTLDSDCRSDSVEGYGCDPEAGVTGSVFVCDFPPPTP